MFVDAINSRLQPDREDIRLYSYTYIKIPLTVTLESQDVHDLQANSSIWICVRITQSGKKIKLC